MEKKKKKPKTLAEIFAEKSKKAGAKKEQDSPGSAAQESPSEDPGVEERVLSRRQEDEERTE
ncbi:MAG: hypothetical protein JRG91_13590, partial [Deltaproteobacteria bacterium]|nr:hypothetical protein [Deltaproteobacteria bacterium]